MLKRYTRSNRCPICGGHESQGRGRGERCYGFFSDDGEYAHCTREEFAGEIDLNFRSSTYAHKMRGECRCGTRHDGGLQMTNRAEDKILCTYKYRDEAGKLLYEAVRLYPKDFRQRRPDGAGGWIWNLDGIRRVLYRLPELLQADPNEIVHIPEGEKDVEALRALGFVATTNAMGAGKWRSEYAESLRGRSCVLLPDNDEPGRKHMAEVARSLTGIAKSVKVVELTGLSPKGDVSDWLAAGGTKEELKQLVAEAQGLRSAPEIAPEVSFQPEPYRDGVWKERKLFETGADFADDAEDCSIEWIVYPWIPQGAMAEVDGKVKAAGKTTFLTHMAAAVIDGRPFMGQPTTKSPVVYLTEQPKVSFRQALKRAGLIGREDFIVLRWNRTIGMNWAEIMKAAIAICLEIGAKFLIVDTLHQFCGVSGDDENSSGKALEAMRPLQEAGAHGIAVAVVRHDRKSGGDPADSARGSSALSGAMDVIIGLRLPEGNTKPNVRVIKTRSRFEETPTELMIEFTEDGYVALGDIQPPTLSKAKDTILNVLPGCMDTALTVDEIMSAGDVSRTTADRALKELLHTGTVQSTGKGKRGDPCRYYRAAIHSFQTPTLKEPSWKEKVRAAATPISAARAILAGIFVRPHVGASSGLCPFPDPSDFDPEFFPEPERPTDACAQCSGTEYHELANQEWVCSACHPA